MAIRTTDNAFLYFAFGLFDALGKRHVDRFFADIVESDDRTERSERADDSDSTEILER